MFYQRLSISISWKGKANNLKVRYFSFSWKQQKKKFQVHLHSLLKSLNILEENANVY